MATYGSLAGRVDLAASPISKYLVGASEVLGDAFRDAAKARKAERLAEEEAARTKEAEERRTKQALDLELAKGGGRARAKAEAKLQADAVTSKYGAELDKLGREREAVDRGQAAIDEQQAGLGKYFGEGATDQMVADILAQADATAAERRNALERRRMQYGARVLTPEETADYAQAPTAGEVEDAASTAGSLHDKAAVRTQLADAETAYGTRRADLDARRKATEAERDSLLKAFNTEDPLDLIAFNQAAEQRATRETKVAEARAAAEAELRKNDRERLEQLRLEARKYGMDDPTIDSDPTLEAYRGRGINDWENIVAIGKQRADARAERRAAADRAALTGKQTIDQEDALRREFNGQIADPLDAERAIRDARAVLTSGKPITDVLALKAVNRIWDKGAFTASDHQTLTQAGGVRDRFNALLDQAATGTMTPEKRQDLVDLLDKMAEANTRNQRELAKRYIGIAGERGYNPRVVVDGRYFDGPSNGGGDGGGGLRRVTVRDPKTGESAVADLTPAQIDAAKARGWEVK